MLKDALSRLTSRVGWDERRLNPAARLPATCLPVDFTTSFTLQHPNRRLFGNHPQYYLTGLYKDPVQGEVARDGLILAIAPRKPVHIERIRVIQPESDNEPSKIGYWHVVLSQNGETPEISPHEIVFWRARYPSRNGMPDPLKVLQEREKADLETFIQLNDATADSVQIPEKMKADISQLIGGQVPSNFSTWQDLALETFLAPLP